MSLFTQSVVEVFSIYFEAINKITRILASDIYGVSLKDDKVSNIDERLAKIDLAKSNLSDALKAIDELKTAAEHNKQDAEQALLQLEQLHRHKDDLEKQIQTLKYLAETDTEAFRRVAGILSPAQIRRERFIGFFSGVLASVVASGVVWLIVKGINYGNDSLSG